MTWEYINTGFATAEQNMHNDYALLQRLSSIKNPLLHFYEWIGDCATYGYFVKPENYFNSEGIKKNHLQIARRPTGGGIVFHNCDFAFSVLVPASYPSYSVNTLENYNFINSITIKAIIAFLGNSKSIKISSNVNVHQNHENDKITLLQYSDIGSCEKKRTQSCNFCMAKPTQYDVMIGGRKVGGAAQRRTKDGFLHQGTISLIVPTKEYLKEVLNVEKSVINDMHQNSFPLLGTHSISHQQIQQAKVNLQQLLSAYFS